MSASGKTSSSEGATGTRRGTRVSAPFARACWPRVADPLQRDDLELGRLGTIQVHKQTETIQRVDVRRDSAEDVKDGGYFERQPTSTIQEERAPWMGAPLDNCGGVN